MNIAPTNSSCGVYELSSINDHSPDLWVGEFERRLHGVLKYSGIRWGIIAAFPDTPAWQDYKKLFYEQAWECVEFSHRAEHHGDDVNKLFLWHRKLDDYILEYKNGTLATRLGLSTGTVVKKVIEKESIVPAAVDIPEQHWPGGGLARIKREGPPEEQGKMTPSMWAQQQERAKEQIRLDMMEAKMKHLENYYRYSSWTPVKS